ARVGLFDKPDDLLGAESALLHVRPLGFTDFIASAGTAQWGQVTLASKGMAKGVKLYKEGKECAPFKIDSIPTVSGPIGTPFDYKINYSGNPAFPVKMYFEVVSCQSGWSCSGGTRTVNVVSSPLTFQISCTGKTTAGTFVYRRWLEDADGVKTAPVDHTYSCVPPKSKMASPVIADESIGITNS
ncbi:hypothetical protein P2A14_11440, partial [Xanthomonas perforans]